MFRTPLILHRDHGAGLHVLILILHQVAHVLTQDELLVDSLEMPGAAVSERKRPQAD